MHSSNSYQLSLKGNVIINNNVTVPIVIEFCDKDAVTKFKESIALRLQKELFIHIDISHMQVFFRYIKGRCLGNKPLYTDLEVKAEDRIGKYRSLVTPNEFIGTVDDEKVRIIEVCVIIVGASNKSMTIKVPYDDNTQLSELKKSIVYILQKELFAKEIKDVKVFFSNDKKYQGCESGSNVVKHFNKDKEKVSKYTCSVKSYKCKASIIIEKNMKVRVTTDGADNRKSGTIKVLYDNNTLVSELKKRILSKLECELLKKFHVNLHISCVKLYFKKTGEIECGHEIYSNTKISDYANTFELNECKAFISHTTENLRFIRIKKIFTLDSTCCKTTFIVDAEGGVYVAGDYINQLEIKNMDNHKVFTKVSMPNNAEVIEVAGTSCTAFFICENGVVYAVGENTYGQLGIGNNLYQRIPVKVESLKHEKVLKIDHIYGSAFFICKSGAVYVGGGNNLYQLIPIRVESLKHEKVIKVTHIYDNMFFICESGTVYVAKKNNNDQLGIDPNNLYHRIPAKVESLKHEKVIKVTHIDGGMFFICESGTVYAVEKNNKLIFVKVEKLKHEKVIKVVGLKSESFALFMCESGAVYIEDGRCFDDGVQKINMSNNENVVNVYLGGCYSSMWYCLFLYESGKVRKYYIRGKVFSEKLNIERVDKVFEAENKFFFICDSGKKVYGMGLNAHGELGVGHNQKVEYPTRIPGVVFVLEDKKKTNFGKKLRKNSRCYDTFIVHGT